MTMIATPWGFLIWAVASWIVGMLGRDTRFGFAGNFLVAFLFSPLVGVLVLLAADRFKSAPDMRRRPRA